MSRKYTLNATSTEALKTFRGNLKDLISDLKHLDAKLKTHRDTLNGTHPKKLTQLELQPLYKDISTLRAKIDETAENLVRSGDTYFDHLNMSVDDARFQEAARIEEKARDKTAAKRLKEKSAEKAAEPTVSNAEKNASDELATTPVERKEVPKVAKAKKAGGKTFIIPHAADLAAAEHAANVAKDKGRGKKGVATPLAAMVESVQKTPVAKARGRRSSK